jgi:cytochrome d ubiquinol oxidase subunit II
MAEFWFVLIGVLWVGYFFLEGFDFGVGILLRRIGRDRGERRALIHSIGPVWDGNEVWLIVAAGATFAAFPDWYATLTSGFYLPLFLLVVALLARPFALEVWGKDDRPGWRNAWEWAFVAGSALPAFLWGLVFANVVRGVPVDGDKEFTGSLLDLLGPYALLGGLTSLLLCAAHGSIFLTLRTRGELLERSRRTALLLVPASAVALTGFVTWTAVHSGESWAIVTGAVAAAAALGVPLLVRAGRSVWAFAAHGLAIAFLFATLFVDLYPNVLVSSTDSAFNLTLENSSSSSYTLTVMTVAAVVLVPVIVAAQAFAYWAFRDRVGPEDFEAADPDEPEEPRKAA